MKWRHALLACALSATVAHGQPATLARTLSVAEAREDFDVLRGAFEEAHGALYRFTPRAELSRRFDGYRARITAPMSPLAFVSLLAEMNAAIGDGHSRFEYDSATMAAMNGAKVFPLRVNVEGDRLVVRSNDTPRDALIRPGDDIVSINGRTAAELLGEILPRIPGDGSIETGKRYRLSRNFSQLYWIFVSQAESFSVVARDAAGRTVTAQLDGVVETARAANIAANPVNAQVQANAARLAGPPDNISLRFLEGVGYLKIRAFDGPTFGAVLDSVFRALRADGTESLILDLRGNGGGVDMYGAKLVSEFADRPFRYFDHIHLASIRPSFATWKPSTFDEVREGTVPDPQGGFLATPKLHAGVSEQAPSPDAFAGKLVVLTDGGTFSTSADVTAVLRHMKRATFVGEETAGAYEGNTSGLNALVILPNSRLRLKVQMFGYVNAVSGGRPGRGTIPDHEVVVTVADILRGEDPALRRAVAMSKGGEPQ